MKIDWRRKLGSRKFWTMVAGFVSSIMYTFNFAETEVTQVTGIITAAGLLAVYILSEGYVDANKDVYIEDTTHYDEYAIGFANKKEE